MIRLDMPNGSEPTIYRDLEQGTDEWLAARCGILTASTIGQLITPKTIKVANNDYSRALTASLVAERVTGYVEPIVPSRDMERGTLDEPYARDAYAKFTGVEVEEVVVVDRGAVVVLVELLGQRPGHQAHARGDEELDDPRLGVLEDHHRTGRTDERVGAGVVVAAHPYRDLA